MTAFFVRCLFIELVKMILFQLSRMNESYRKNFAFFNANSDKKNAIDQINDY